MDKISLLLKDWKKYKMKDFKENNRSNKELQNMKSNRNMITFF